MQILISGLGNREYKWSILFPDSGVEVLRIQCSVWCPPVKGTCIAYHTRFTLTSVYLFYEFMTCNINQRLAGHI
jgi:hypothetical protein